MWDDESWAWDPRESFQEDVGGWTEDSDEKKQENKVVGVGEEEEEGKERGQ